METCCSALRCITSSSLMQCSVLVLHGRLRTCCTQAKGSRNKDTTGIWPQRRQVGPSHGKVASSGKLRVLPFPCAVSLDDPAVSLASDDWDAALHLEDVYIAQGREEGLR